MRTILTAIAFISATTLSGCCNNGCDTCANQASVSTVSCCSSTPW